MLAVIDSDSIVYSSAGATQKKNKETGEIEVAPVSHACSNAKKMMLSILEATKCSDYIAYLTESSDATSFRLKLYPEYKANRKDYEKPIHYQAVRDYLVSTWKAEIVSEIEADDAVAMKMHEIYQDKEYTIDTAPAVLCGIDKDLRQIPGLHFNYNTGEFQWIKKEDAIRSIYIQLLEGDRSDNIPRVKKGWRSKNTIESLNKVTKEIEYYQIVKDVIKTEQNKSDKEADDYVQLMGSLLYLRKYPKDQFKIPV